MKRSLLSLELGSEGRGRRNKDLSLRKRKADSVGRSRRQSK